MNLTTIPFGMEMHCLSQQPATISHTERKWISFDKWQKQRTQPIEFRFHRIVHRASRMKNEHSSSWLSLNLHFCSFGLVHWYIRISCFWFLLQRSVIVSMFCCEWHESRYQETERNKHPANEVKGNETIRISILGLLRFHEIEIHFERISCSQIRKIWIPSGRFGINSITIQQSNGKKEKAAKLFQMIVFLFLRWISTANQNNILYVYISNKCGNGYITRPQIQNSICQSLQSTWIQLKCGFIHLKTNFKR